MSESFAERAAEHEWRHRLLLVFAPNEDDEKLAEQKTLLEGGEPGFEERGLDPIYLPADDEVREHFGVEGDVFAAILIGKDGTEKARFERPVEPEELFRRVDEMPVRKSETRRREMGV